MEFLHASIALLASMVLVLAAMVGWLYWQQTRLFQNMNSIVMVIGELVRPTPPPTLEEKEVLEEMTKMNELVPEAVEQEDDRVSVEAEPKVDVVSGPPEPIDTDELDGKTKKELHEMLTKRGIPFGKNDAKPVLISLLKATA
jgi:hypothetical protein